MAEAATMAAATTAAATAVETRLHLKVGQGQDDVRHAFRKAFGHKPQALGGGTFGNVWRVELAGQEWALKVPTTAGKCCMGLGSWREAANLLVLETVSQGGHKHPNLLIPRVLHTRGDMMVHMMPVAQGSLHDLLSSGRTLDAAPERAWDLVHGLRFLHYRGLAHLDLKPANIMVFPQGPGEQLRIGDFGTMRLDQGGAAYLHTTTAYRSPEYLLAGQTIGGGRVDDIWSLGCVLHEMCTGRRLIMTSETKPAVLQIQVELLGRLRLGSRAVSAKAEEQVSRLIKFTGGRTLQTMAGVYGQLMDQCLQWEADGRVDTACKLGQWAAKRTWYDVDTGVEVVEEELASKRRVVLLLDS